MPATRADARNESYSGCPPRQRNVSNDRWTAATHVRCSPKPRSVLTDLHNHIGTAISSNDPSQCIDNDRIFTPATSAWWRACCSPKRQPSSHRQRPSSRPVQNTLQERKPAAPRERKPATPTRAEVRCTKHKSGSPLHHESGSSLHQRERKSAAPNTAEARCTTRAEARCSNESGSPLHQTRERLPTEKRTNARNKETLREREA